MIITTRVHTKSSKPRIEKGEVWEIWVKSPPEKNKANNEVIKLMSNELKVPKSKIELLSGLKSKTKRFRVDI